jgi:spore coat polysaccharide biosynthesis protein SpsF
MVKKNMIAAILQARMGSTRLPGKTLADINGKPLLSHILERIHYSRLIDEIVVATTTQRRDDVIVNLCEELAVKSFRGSEDDVLDRFYQCAKQFHAQYIVRCTADDPFKDPEVIDRIIKELLADNSIDYASNTIKPTYPEGIDIEVFKFQALERAWKEASKTSDREHVTPYIWRNPHIFRLKNVENDIDLSSLRWTLDTPKDLKLAKTVYKELYVQGKIFLMKDILALLDRRPELRELNAGIERYAGYKKSLQEDTPS